MDSPSEVVSAKGKTSAPNETLKITDLPHDVLRNVFDWFQDDRVRYGRRQVEWSLGRRDPYVMIQESAARRETIHKLRLVCRLFCDLASPLMFPILRLQLSQSSLDLADKIARSPAMAAGVRGIRLQLNYRPKDLVDNIAQFVDIRSWRVESIAESCRRQLRRREPHEVKLRKALDNMYHLRSEWNAYVKGEECTGTPLSEYQEVLRRGHGAFTRLHQDQTRLLQDGRFANTLASAVSRMGNVRSFCFHDQNYYDEFRRDPELLVTDNEVLARFLATPMAWDEIDGWGETYELAIARMLWELPIALHNAGSPITELDLNVMPIMSNFSMLCPLSQREPGEPAWVELGAACENLRVFTLSVRHRPTDRPPQLGKSEKVMIDRYLGSVLSRCGPHLRQLDLEFQFLTTYTKWQYVGFREVYYHAGPALSALENLPRLHHLTISHAQLQQTEVDALCSKLGNRIERLVLRSITLRSGRWADAVDTLRKKRDGSIAPLVGGWASIESLWGGEFVERPVTFDPTRIVSMSRPKYHDDLLLLETRNFVNGHREDNPLRAVQVQRPPKIPHWGSS